MKKLQRFFDDVIKNNPKKLVQWSEAFVKNAAKNSPPQIGKASISREFYTRPILNLIKLARGEYNAYRFTQQDSIALKNKMIFKIINTKKGVKKNTAFGYAKTQAQAKKLAKIQTRGNLRYQWGKNLNDIGGKIPTSILALQRKAKALKDLDYNKIYFTDNKSTVIIQNAADFATEGVLSIAIKAGLRNVRRLVNKYRKQISAKIDDFNRKN